MAVGRWWFRAHREFPSQIKATCRGEQELGDGNNDDTDDTTVGIVDVDDDDDTNGMPIDDWCKGDEELEETDGIPSTR
jgi:hypothetical protein